MIWKTNVLAETERGLLLRDGQIIDLIAPGRHRWPDPLSRLTLEIADTRTPVVPAGWAVQLERNHRTLAEAVMIFVRPAPETLALVSLNGAAFEVVPHGQMRAFWTVADEVDVEVIDLETAHRIDPLKAARWARAAGMAIVQAQIPEAETGLVFVDGRVHERLAPGRYAFWAANRAVRVVKYDLRPETHDVVAQEILTKDRVTVRINLTAMTRVVDPALLVARLPDKALHLHRLVQLAARSMVGGRTLDDLLKERTELDRMLTEMVRTRVGAVGLEVMDVRIKDIILPGDMRELLNRVVEAEKAAEANLIRRREETAATRSLLNTARMMESHPTLMRLKELEALERLTDKVGRIDVHQTAEGAGLPALLDSLMGNRAKTQTGSN